MKKNLFFLFVFVLLVLIACEDKPEPNQPPALSISANPASGVGPLSVNFAAAGQDPENQLMVYSWNFGDGKGTSVQQNPVYIYTDTGVFTATCSVTDSGSPPLTATASVQIEVLANKPTLSSVAPNSCVMHIPSFTLTAAGSNFHEGAKICFNSVEMNTNYVSSRKIYCTIQPDDTIIQSLMSNDSGVIPDTSTTVKVKVINPGSCGGESATIDFTIYSNYSFENPKTMDTRSGYDLPAILIDRSSKLNLFEGELQHTQSTDGGDTWSAFVRVTDKMNTMGNRDYSVCTDADNNLYVAFTGEPWCWCESKFSDIWLASLTGSDIDWKNENLTSEWPFEPGGEIPSITAMNGTLILVFGLGADYGGYYNAFMLPPWTAWDTPPNMSGAKESEHSVITDPSQNLHFGIITITYNTGITPNLIHFSSTKDLSSWSSTHLISASDGNASAISLVSDPNGILYAFWLDGAAYNKPQKLYFSHSIDSGEKWTNRRVLSSAGGYHFISAQTDSAGNLIIVFSKEDYGAEKIYFFRSIDGGENWTASKKVTDQDGRSSWQALAIDSAGRLHIVWQGGGVYYTRSVID